MAWQTISTDNVKTRLAGAEVAALQTAALAEGQSDPLPEIVQTVVDEVRGYIAAGGFSLGAAGTLPSKLVSAALAIVRYRVCTRLPVKSLLTEQRVRENDAAVRLLERVADGKFMVEDPVDLDTEASGGASPSFADRDLSYQREDQDGL